MLCAFSASTLFLVGYISRFVMTGVHRYPVADWTRTVYLAILLSHTILAVLTVPLVLSTLYFALRHQFATHRKIARVTFPIWLYVSATGVLVYFFLYHVATWRV